MEDFTAFASTQEKLLEHHEDPTEVGFGFALCQGGSAKTLWILLGVSSTQDPDRVKEGIQLEIQGPRSPRGNGAKWWKQ